MVLSASPIAPAAAPRWPAQATALGRSAIHALYQELALYPKPGLVSFVDTGSHADMDARTFLRSLFALRHYFPLIAAAGARGDAFPVLAVLGREAERRMLRATGNVNTHRGAVFSLGLLCAAAGRLLAGGETNFTPARLRERLLAQWGAALAAHAGERRASNGCRAAAHYGLRSVSEEAAAGFPVLFDTTLPALRAALAKGWTPQQARLQAFFATMAVLEDTNLAHRGGLGGLQFAQTAAREFLAGGGAGAADAERHAAALHRAFVARWLSPGGSADVLAAACWLQRVCD